MVSCFSASKTTQNKMTIGLMFRPCKAICFQLDPLCTKPCRILHHVGSYTYVTHGLVVYVDTILILLPAPTAVRSRVVSHCAKKYRFLK
jgi:hypothetical protein